MRMSKADRTLIRAVESLKMLITRSPEPRDLAMWAIQHVQGAQRASQSMLAFFDGSAGVLFVEPPRRKKKDAKKATKKKKRGGKR